MNHKTAFFVWLALTMLWGLGLYITSKHNKPTQRLLLAIGCVLSAATALAHLLEMYGM